MLSRNKRQESERTHHNHATSLIARGTSLRGDLSFKGALHMDGNIEGKVYGEGEQAVFTLSEHGQVKGEIHGAHIVIDGQVNGDVFASIRLELAPKARINGDVHYRTLEMAAGAQVNGRMAYTEKNSEVTRELPSPAAVTAGSEASVLNIETETVSS